VRRADHSSRGVLPSVVCLSVIVKPRKMRRARPPRGCRAVEKKKKKCLFSLSRSIVNEKANICLSNKIS
jgi:hypothetical protein